MKRDIYGELIPDDLCADSPEGVTAWNTLARLSVEEGLAFFTDHDGNRVDTPSFDTEGRILWRAIEQEVDDRPAPHLRTLSDVMPLDMDDAFDRAMATLPVYASLTEKAKAALRANVPGVVVQSRLRCSGATVGSARTALRAQLPEAEWPESLTNAKGQARRVNADRPHMLLGSGTHPMERHAADLGVSVAEACMIASDKARVTKFGERARDLEAATRAREYRARKKAERIDE